MRISNTRSAGDPEPLAKYLARKMRDRVRQWKNDVCLRTWPLHCNTPVNPIEEINAFDSRDICVELECVKCGHRLSEDESEGKQQQKWGIGT